MFLSRKIPKTTESVMELVFFDFVMLVVFSRIVVAEHNSCGLLERKN